MPASAAGWLPMVFANFWFASTLDVFFARTGGRAQLNGDGSMGLEASMTGVAKDVKLLAKVRRKHAATCGKKKSQKDRIEN